MSLHEEDIDKYVNNILQRYDLMAEKNAEAGLTDQQKELIKSGLEQQAAAQNGVTAGAANEKITAEQKHAESVKRAAETYYANKRR